MEIKLPEIEPNNTLPNVISGFATVFSFIRKLYYVIYNAIAKIAGNPTKVI